MPRQTGVMTPAPEPEEGAGEGEGEAVPIFAEPTSTRGLPAQPCYDGDDGMTGMETGALASVDAVLAVEAALEAEYPDAFVTQVYNYLSLGYPSLARPFDEELSKISKIEVKELRADDELAKQSPRGYIRLGSDFEGGGGDGLTEQSCVRWKALKLYIREWARQEDQGMIGSTELPGRGVGVRRGSWAH